MPQCESAAQFWIALPATIGALGAFVAAWRNGRKTDKVVHNLAAHSEASATRYRAYNRVIADLEPRVERIERGE
jgi:hypothetical protein